MTQQRAQCIEQGTRPADVHMQELTLGVEHRQTTTTVRADRDVCWG